jgi:excisionase family DNA binding protein
MKKEIGSKTQVRRRPRHASMLVQSQTQEKVERLLEIANRNSPGRRIVADDVISLALDLLTEGHVRLLQERLLTEVNRNLKLSTKVITSAQNGEEDGEWLTTEEAASYLGTSANAVRILVCRGKVKTFKLGRRLRFKASDLRLLLRPKGGSND